MKRFLYRGLGWTALATGSIWIVYVLVAVATHVKGFDTFWGLVPAFAFHALATLLGLQLLHAASGARAVWA